MVTLVCVGLRSADTACVRHDGRQGTSVHVWSRSGDIDGDTRSRLVQLVLLRTHSCVRTDTMKDVRLTG